MTSSKLRILHSLAEPLSSLDFASMAADMAPAAAEVRYFSWKEALLGDFDVFHTHWPEYNVRHRRRAVAVLKQVLYLLLLLRLVSTRKPLVRTLHNLRPHEPGGRVERALLALTDACTTTFVALNPFTPVPTIEPGDRRRSVHHVPLPHYVHQVATYGFTSPVPGRLLLFGHLRAYKGLDELVAAFRAAVGEDLSLHLVGPRDGTPTTERLLERCRDDPRITVSAGYASDEALVREVIEAELVVLPIANMHNSSSVLLALSVGTPVLAPLSAVNQGLAAELRAGSLHLYDGPLTPELLSSALTRSAGGRRVGPAFVDPSQRSVAQVRAHWDGVYRRALRGRHGVV